MASDYEMFLKELEARRAPAMKRAAELLELGRFEEAEQAVRSADDSIYGAVALGRLFTERLRTLAAAGETRTPRAIETFRRAVSWRTSAYPEPHTECEADNYREGAAQDRAELVKVLGWDPGR